MTVRARLQWTLVTLWILGGILTVICHGPLPLALAFFLPLAWTSWRRMRLTADQDGVTIINFFRTYRIPWAETIGFDWTFEHATVSINVLLRDGTRRHFWFAAPELSYRSWRRDPINPTSAVGKLSLLRARTLGEPAPPAEIEDALSQRSLQYE